MISADELKNKLNIYASNKEPFLFGIDYEMSQGFFIEKPLEQKEILWRVPGVSNYEAQDKTVNLKKIENKSSKFLNLKDSKNRLLKFKDNNETLYTKSKARKFISLNITFEEYKKKFNIIQYHLKRGDSFLTNLTVKTEIETDYSFREIFERSNSPYALLIPNKLVCFSPEIFVKIKNGKISSNPMKGTIDAKIPNAKNIIMADYKETSEHYTVVDLIRNDLNIVSKNVKVDKLRYCDKLHTSRGDILQISSLISGDYNNQKLGDAIFKLLPAGSISGAPKPATLSSIKEAEIIPRGFYSGVFGYFDGESLDTAVMIRYIEKENNKLFFRSGGGITINSDCKDEYNEVIEKIYLPFDNK